LSITRFIDDKLNAVTVKELRLSLKSNLFIIFFLISQVLLLIYTVSSVFLIGSSSSSSGFWVIISIPTLVLLPLRAAFIMQVEDKYNTKDMLVISLLKPKQIVMGKLYSILGEFALILLSAVPYMLLRFYYQNVNLVFEFIILFSLIAIIVFGCSVLLLISALSDTGAMGQIILFAVSMIFSAVAFSYLVYLQGLNHLIYSRENIYFLVINFIFMPLGVLLFVDLTANYLIPENRNCVIYKRIMCSIVTITLMIYYCFYSGETLFYCGLGIICLLSFVNVMPEKLATLTECRFYLKNTKHAAFKGIVIASDTASNYNFFMINFIALLSFWQFFSSDQLGMYTYFLPLLILSVFLIFVLDYILFKNVIFAYLRAGSLILPVTFLICQYFLINDQMMSIICCSITSCIILVYLLSIAMPTKMPIGVMNIIFGIAMVSVVQHQGFSNMAKLKVSKFIFLLPFFSVKLTSYYLSILKIANFNEMVLGISLALVIIMHLALFWQRKSLNKLWKQVGFH